jgi:hypothetical protein
MRQPTKDNRLVETEHDRVRVRAGHLRHAVIGGLSLSTHVTHPLYLSALPTRPAAAAATIERLPIMQQKARLLW